MERDIKRDKEFAVRQAAYFRSMRSSESDLEVLISRLPHYLTRTEHLERMVDAAVEYMTHGTNGFEHGICGLCPLGPNTDCRAITATDCKRLVHDYLDAKAKEGAK